MELPDRRFRTYSLTEIARFAEKIGQDAKAHPDKICHASVTNLPHPTLQSGPVTVSYPRFSQNIGIAEKRIDFQEINVTRAAKSIG